jgi:hypothetical protein
MSLNFEKTENSRNYSNLYGSYQKDCCSKCITLINLLIIFYYQYLKNVFNRSERLRWIEAVSQPISDNPNEVIYEEWGIKYSQNFH